MIKHNLKIQLGFWQHHCVTPLHYFNIMPLPRYKGSKIRSRSKIHQFLLNFDNLTKFSLTLTEFPFISNAF
jgi:hypothetical protein